jgi:lysophospholipase L1-like esterase
MPRLLSDALTIPRRGAFPPGARLAIISDSFGAANGNRQSGYPQAFTSTTGVASMLEAFTQGRFRFSLEMNKSVSGNSTTQMLARFATDIEANFDLFDILMIDGGRNDGQASKANGDTTIANLMEMASRGVVAGKPVIMMTPNPPRTFGITTDAQRRVRGYVNREVKRRCAMMKGVVYIDFWRDWVDPTLNTGAPAAGITYDQMHPDVTGAVFAARRLIDTIGFAFPLPPKDQAQWDWYDASMNPAGNLLALKGTPLGNTPRMGGTGGTISTYAGGTAGVAANFAISRVSGTGTEVTASKEAGVAGYDSAGGDKQVLTVAALSGPTLINLQTDIGSAPPAGVMGGDCFAQCEVEVSNLVGLTSFTLTLQYWNGSANQVSVALNNGTGAVIPLPNGKYMLRTPNFTVTALAQNLQWIFNAGFNTGGSGIIKVGAPGIWPVIAA